MIKSSLGTRIFLATSLIVVLAVASAVLTTWIVGSQIAEQAVHEDLARSGSVQALFEQGRMEFLRVSARTLASDPNFVAYVLEAGETGDALSIVDQLEDRQRDLGFDLTVALDPDGVVLGRTDQLAVGTDLSQDPLIARAFEDLEALGVWSSGEQLFFAAAVPMTAGGYLQGYLIAGLALGDAAAIELRRISNTEVSFVRFDDGHGRLQTTTLGAGLTEDLEKLLADGSLFVGPDGGVSSARVPDGVQDEVLRNVVLGGSRYLALVRPLFDVDGRPVGAVLGLASPEAHLEPFERIGRTLLWVGLLAIVLAMVSSYLLPRRMLRPERELVAAAKAAAEGDYDTEIAVDRPDEIGQLAEAFRSLLSELREKRDMELYITELTRNLPDESPAIPRSDSGSGSGARAGSGSSPEAGPETDELAITATRALTTPLEPIPFTTLSDIGPGSQLGRRFSILSVLGAGGFGVVYKARDNSLDELVALKMLKPEVWDDSERLDKLKDELKLARKIAHANVLRTFDFGEIDGVPFISMEYVRGITLRRLLDQSGRLPLSAGLRLARQLCRGLAAAHDQAVLHRDIKPENLIIEHTGNVKLMDFGIAQQIRHRPAETSEQGTVLGTPFYLAPEQLRGQEPDVRADLYACGVVFYELFTGRLPFPPVGNLMQIVTAKLNTDPSPPSRHWPAMPGALERIILRCLERERDRRYASAERLLDELEVLRA